MVFKSQLRSERDTSDSFTIEKIKDTPDFWRANFCLVKKKKSLDIGNSYIAKAWKKL